MATYTQAERRLSLTTPLGPDALLLTAFSGREELSRPFAYQMELLSEKDAIKGEEIIGKSVTWSVLMPDDSKRFFNGIVRRFSYKGTDDRLSRYRMEVVPWLWLLTRTTDCRIFQKKSVPDILALVFKDLGFTDFTPKLRATYDPMDYCVQYRESDFDFASRLMEEEGIFYFFKHEDGKHTLVFADHKGAYEPAVEKEVDFSVSLSQPEAYDQLLSWEHRYEFRSGKVAQQSFNFEKPSSSLMAKTDTLLKVDAFKKFELYDYPGHYVEKGRGEDLAKVRMEAEEAAYDVVAGSSRCRSFSPGLKFTIRRHHCKAEEGKGYVLTSVEHRATEAGGYATGGGEASELDYSNAFECIPDATVFRPARLTPKPLIHGTQTATVVGPSGEKIFVDKHGRVKVQFHWDREGKKDDNSSCWVRVSQPWGGAGWGGMFNPHVGQEVVVSFMEGDPDRPLITGRVYNAEQQPPLTPGKKTKSAIRDHGGNEIIMEGDAGVQQVRIFSPTHNSTITMGAPNSLPGIRAITDQFIHLVSGNDTKIDVTANYYIAIKGSQHDNIVGLKSVFIGGVQNTVIIGAKHEKIGGAEFKSVYGLKHDVTKGMRMQITPSKDGKSYAECFQKVKAGAMWKTSGAMWNTTKNFFKTTGTHIVKAGGDLKEKAEKAYIDYSLLKQKIAGDISTKASAMKQKLSGEFNTKCAEAHIKASGAIKWVGSQLDALRGKLKIK